MATTKKTGKAGKKKPAAGQHRTRPNTIMTLSPEDKAALSQVAERRGISRSRVAGQLAQEEIARLALEDEEAS